MVKCITFKCNNNHKNIYTIHFCIDNNFHLETKKGCVECHAVLKDLNELPVCVLKRIPQMMEKKELMEKMTSMNYKEAANFYYDYQKSKDREGKLFEGEFNDK